MTFPVPIARHEKNSRDAHPLHLTASARIGNRLSTFDVDMTMAFPTPTTSRVPPFRLSPPSQN